MTLPRPYRVVLFAGSLLVAWTLFWQLTILLLAVLLTVIVALPLTRATDWLHGHRVPRAVGAIGCVLIGLVALAGFGALIAPTLVAQVERLLDELPAVVQRLSARLGVRDEGGAAADAGLQLQTLLRGYVEDPASLVGPIRTVLTSAVAVTGGILLVLLTAVYAAIDPRPLVAGLLRLVSPEGRPRAELVLGRLAGSWLGWLKGTAVDMVLTGALTFAALSLLGIEHALVFALLTALLEAVPYFGPILAAIPPVLFALTQSVELAALTLATYAVIQQVESNVIVPLVMARAVQLHPAVVAIGVVVVGQLLGVMGVLLAVPILTGLVILAQELWVLPRERRVTTRRASHRVPAVTSLARDRG